MGCEALPALSSLACCLRTLSFTVSQRAVICTPSTAEKFSIREPPRPPVPITPMRTVPVGLKFTPAMLLEEPCERASPAPIPAREASFNKSRLEVLSIFLFLFPEFLDYLNHNGTTDHKYDTQYDC